jgi:L-2,4-diaminobutyrate decarboxylase
VADHNHLHLHHFDQDAEHFAEQVLAYAVSKVRHEQDDGLFDAPSVAELDRGLSGSITQEGLGLERAFGIYRDVIAASCLCIEHPRFFAFVPYSPAVPAVLLDMALSASGIFGTSWLEAAGSAAAENQALRWLSDLAGMPSSSGGTFLSGGTIANVNGLALARHNWRARHGDSGRRVAVAASAEVHSSVRTSAKALEIDILDVQPDERGRLTGVNLAAVLEASDAEVCGVAATGGITNLGIVDDLAGIAEVARARGLWLHVDAAYGGAALISEQTRALFTGIEQADSLVIDPHKWLFAPLDCSALIYRNPALAVGAFTQTAAYLDAFHETDETNPGDLAVHLTRRARGLPFWFTLCAGGTVAMKAAVEHSLMLARQSARMVERTSYLELAIEPELSVVVFRRLGWSASQCRAWCARLLTDGVAMVLPTNWRGETLLRFCFVNPRTTIEDVQMLIDSLANDRERD